METKENPAKDTKALSYTVEGVSETIFNDLKDLISGKESCKVLAETYEDKKKKKRKVSIIKELVMGTCFADCKDMTDYLQRTISAYQQLKVTVVKSDELNAGIVPANLPDQFETLITAFKNCGEEITVGNVKNRLLAEDAKPQINDNRTLAGPALVTVRPDLKPAAGPPYAIYFQL